MPHRENCQCAIHIDRSIQPNIKCPVCETWFYRAPKRIRDWNFCSKKCQDSLQARELGYHSGPSIGKYPPYRRKALEAFGHTCQVCSYDIIVEVDHIDGDHNNVELTNLQVLCPNHHAEKTFRRGVFALIA